MQGNVTAIIIILSQAIIGLVFLIRLEGSVRKNTDDIRNNGERCEKIETAVQTLDERLDHHIADNDAHVNHLYMSTIKDHLKKLEAMVQNGDRRIEERLDKLTEKFYSSQK